VNGGAGIVRVCGEKTGGSIRRHTKTWEALFVISIASWVGEVGGRAIFLEHKEAVKKGLLEKSSHSGGRISPGEYCNSGSDF